MPILGLVARAVGKKILSDFLDGGDRQRQELHQRALGAVRTAYVSTMTSIDVKVDGLDRLRRNLRAAGQGLEKDLRRANLDAAQIVASEAQRRVPKRTGKTAGTVRALASQRDARVRAGGTRAPHYPWLEYGGKRPRDRAGRPRVSGGRYLYPAIADVRDQVVDVHERAVRDILRRSGLG